MAKSTWREDFFCENINENTKKWLDEYKEIRSADYRKLIRIFSFRDYQNKPFDTFIDPDWKSFIVGMENGKLAKDDVKFSKDTINEYVRVLCGLKEFYLKNSLVSKDFLPELLRVYYKKVPPSDAFALEYDQINLIREFNRQNIQHEYIFEIYFQLGIMKKEIIVCNPNNINNDSSGFKNSKGMDIKYNAKIVELLKRLSKSKKEIKLTESTVNYYLSKVTEYLKDPNRHAYAMERPLKYSDLIESHKKYILKCPFCGQFTENVAKSWVLIKTEQAPDFSLYRLVCSQCKGVKRGN